MEYTAGSWFFLTCLINLTFFLFFFFVFFLMKETEKNKREKLIHLKILLMVSNYVSISLGCCSGGGRKRCTSFLSYI
jgi:cell division protein FtsW (lipid II flippase)